MIPAGTGGSELMSENEPRPTSAPEANAPITPDKPVISHLTPAQLDIIHRPGGPFREVIAVGFTALDGNDLKLAEACADHTLSRARRESGDVIRACVLKAEVLLRKGDIRQHDRILNEVLAGGV
jgi:hypothetical protein